MSWPPCTPEVHANSRRPEVPDADSQAGLLRGRATGRGLALGLQGHAGQRGAVAEQSVLDLGIAGGGVYCSGFLVIEIAARHPCARIRAVRRRPAAWPPSVPGPRWS